MRTSPKIRFNEQSHGSPCHVPCFLALVCKSETIKSACFGDGYIQRSNVLVFFSLRIQLEKVLKPIDTE